jgi:hypothetical protein
MSDANFHRHCHGAYTHLLAAINAWRQEHNLQIGDEGDDALVCALNLTLGFYIARTSDDLQRTRWRNAAIEQVRDAWASGRARAPTNNEPCRVLPFPH